jgi:hypothetical protein
MQKTYCGRTAGGLLKAARVQMMRAGNAEIVITLPDGSECCARLADRPDGWGGTVRDALALFDVYGTRAILSTSARALSVMVDLEARAEKMMRG